MTTKKLISRILLVLAGIIVLGSLYYMFVVGNNINWKESLQNDPADGPIAAYTATGISSGRYTVVLLADEGTCTIEKPGGLQPPTKISSGRPGRSSYQAPPDKADLVGIQRDGKTWRWVWTAIPSSTNYPKITCTTEYLLMKVPTGPFLSGRVIGYCLFLLAMVLGLTGLVLDKRAKAPGYTRPKR